ncbi:hypothetical protein [Corynebacterium sp. A21]|uniref:hypothetical protein n=1 Tax=Corynebacterium sp. A21 TaxID=3457318 RepID=UPI003FD4F3DA
MSVPTFQEIIDLLRHGDTVPYQARLARTQALSAGEPLFVATHPEDPFIAPDPVDLQVSRHGLLLHLRRGDTEILRRNRQECWGFGEDGELPVPTHHHTPRFQGIGAVLWLVLSSRELSENLPRYLSPPAAITTGLLLGRKTWLIHFLVEHGPLVIHLDQETGVMLAVEHRDERVEVTEITFPSEIPDPAWPGPAQEQPALGPAELIPPPPDTASVPGYLAAIPAHPESLTGRPLLRVLISEVAMEGTVPDYRVGQTIRLALGFDATGTAPVDNLLSSRRGFINPHNAEPNVSRGKVSWESLFRGDGWAATLYSRIPAIGDQTLSGYFFDATHGTVDYLNHMKITRIFAEIGYHQQFESPHRFWQEVTAAKDGYIDAQGWHPRNLILDVSLDEVAPPPSPRHFRDTQVAADDSRLWILDRELPVARSFDLATGAFLGETLIPVPVLPLSGLRLRADSGRGAVVTGATGSFLLGEESVAQPIEAAVSGPPQRSAPLQLPDGWELSRDLDDGLVRLARFNLTSGRFDYAVALTGSDGPDKTPRLRPLLTERETLLAGFRFGEGYLVSSGNGTAFHLDADLNLLRVEPPAEDPLRYESWGHVITLTSKRGFRFLDKGDGRQLSSIDIPPGEFLYLARASRAKIVVAVHSQSAYHGEGRALTEVRTWTPETGWHAAALNGAPRELCADWTSG